MDLGLVTERGRLLPGGLFNEDAATSATPLELKASLVASSPITEVIFFTAAQLAQVTGGRTIRRMSGYAAPGTLRGLNFSDLELHRIIGTGQFGAVRLVRSKVTSEVYALKVRFSGFASDVMVIVFTHPVMPYEGYVCKPTLVCLV